MNNLEKKFQRDEFIKVIYEAAKKNPNIYFLSADFGAPALDNFRLYLKKQFLHLGICEQNMIDFSCGMALEGAKIYAYAMAPFLALRCLEQHKTATCLMNANVCSIVTGIGLSYANSGPTHYSTEDFACLRSLSNCIIYTASDPIVASLIAKKTLKLSKPIFVRLDRKASYNISKKINLRDINAGYRYLKKSSKKKLLIISQGTIIERALAATKILDQKYLNLIDVIDLIQAKPFPGKFKSILKKYSKIITIDEQTSQGSLGSLIKENINHYVKFKSLSLPDTFIFENSSRDKLLDSNGLSVKNISKEIVNILC
jgi:transketolase